MKVTHNSTSEATWRAWKKFCAADLCSPEQNAELRRFGAQRFSTYVNRYAASVGHFGKSMQVADTHQAWHLLETHAQLSNTKSGKTYKTWLFHCAEMRSNSWVSAIEAGASLLMRDATREYLRREYAAGFMTSLNKPMGSQPETAITLEDLLPDHVDVYDEVAQREWQELADAFARRFFAAMPERDQRVLWARRHDIALTDPRLLKWTQSSQSTLHKCHRDTVQLLCEKIKLHYPDETPALWTYFAGLCLQALHDLADEKIISEKSAARFFKTT